VVPFFKYRSFTFKKCTRRTFHCFLDTEERGRGRFKEKVPATKRAQSAHCTLRTPATTNHPNQSTASERAQSKDDKNKNNAIIANNATRRNFERISKEKSPSARKFLS